jgi:adenylate cyclase
LYSSRNRQKLRRGLAVLTGAAIVLFCGLDSAGTLDWLENRSADWRVRATLDPSLAAGDIVVIDIDNASFRVLTEDLGRWPWTRRVWTELLNYLGPGNPREVLFDILFSGSEPEADPGFAAAMKAAGNVILPFAFVAADVKLNVSQDPPSLALLPWMKPAGPGLRKSEWLLNVPNPAFQAAMAGSGSNLGNADADGITRRLKVVQEYEGDAYATLWLAAAAGPEGVKGLPRVPVDANGQFILRWHGTPQTAYKRIPLMEMVCSMQPEICDANVKRHPPEEFRGKIVIVGASAAGSYEVRPVAVSETAPGMFILATAIDNLMHHRAMTRSPQWLTWLLATVLAGLPAFGVGWSRGLRLPLLITLAVAAVFGGVCFFLYARGIWLTMAAPLLAAAVSFSGNTAYRYLTVDRELSRTRNTLEAYVSPQLVRYVMDHLDSIRFDGQKRKLTILFSDVRSFTTLTEKSDPVRLLKQLNEYLEAMTDIIFKYEGIVDKFIGDGIMAHWGAFTPDHPNAELAARAALEMLEKLASLNTKWDAEGYPPLDIGVGLNTAEVIFGNVGAGKKLDFTAIGDGVNLAARLEGANKEYKTHIIISESTRQELGDQAEVAPLGSIVVKGKTLGVEIFELRSLRKT